MIAPMRSIVVPLSFGQTNGALGPDLALNSEHHLLPHFGQNRCRPLDCWEGRRSRQDEIDLGLH